MLEFLSLSGFLTLLLVLASRKGIDHLLGPRLVWTLMGAGWGVGLVIESMPSTAVTPGFTWRTFCAGLIGLFVGRLLYRIAQAWALAHRNWKDEENAEPPRLLHPVIAVGLFVSGVPVLFAAAAARHEALEFETTVRDRETGIVRGAEPVRLTTDKPTDHAVLLVHGFLGSPAEFGPLPAALRDLGMTVHAPLLPGHGTRPDDLADVLAEDHVNAVGEAWDELANAHEKVSVVGFSMGAAAWVLASEGRDAYRIVLVNPYVGDVTTPGWSPLDVDTLIDLAGKVTPRVIRMEMFVRLNKRDNLRRVRSYRTVPLRAAAQLRELGSQVREIRPWATTAPTLVIVSDGDETLPPASAVAFEKELEASGEPHELARFGESNHLLFLDHDADAAVSRTLLWLSR